LLRNARLPADFLDTRAVIDLLQNERDLLI
jgi:hypothetical protein